MFVIVLMFVSRQSEKIDNARLGDCTTKLIDFAKRVIGRRLEGAVFEDVTTRWNVGVLGILDPEITL